MRASKNSSSDELRERYLGEIAPLFDAAREIDGLSEVQKKQVRRRIARTLFRTRFLSFRVRLVPALAALGMLVIGGAAFATAERLGLISKIGAKASSQPASQPKQDVRKRRNLRSTGRAQGPGLPESTDNAPASSEAATGALPEVSAPPVFPVAAASTGGGSPLSKASDMLEPLLAVPATTGESVPVAPAGKPATSSRVKRLAYLEAVAVVARPAPVMAAPAPVHAGQAMPPETPPPVQQEPTPVQPAGSLVPVSPTPAALAPFLPEAQVAAPIAPAAVGSKPVATLSDQALFGQAMRKLRMERDPAAALSALHEHSKAYPRSSLGGERSALEVEALLALHRDRDALVRLDTMALDELPRSGERFVVRGELRAAARRWSEASADFDRALSRVTGSPAWHERALWGRGAARLRSGEREGGMADLERYLDKYPNGRFAAEAGKFFPNR